MVLCGHQPHAGGRRGRSSQHQDRCPAGACEPDGQRSGPEAQVARDRGNRKVSPGGPEIALPVVEPPGAVPRLDVKTPVFEGPLELLLALVEREEVDIFEVSLAKVTDSYLIELAGREVAEPAEMAEFLCRAARLLLLKSIRLLPGETPTDEETELLGWEEEVRQRLEEYRAYKEMAQGLMKRAEQEPFAFPPPARPVDAAGQEEPRRGGVLAGGCPRVLARSP